jgi:hypothetical protein
VRACHIGVIRGLALAFMHAHQCVDAISVAAAHRPASGERAVSGSAPLFGIGLPFEFVSQDDHDAVRGL